MHTGFHFGEQEPFFVFQGQEIPIILAVAAAAVALEIFLSRREDRRLGLLPPAACLLWTLGLFITRLVSLGGFAAMGEYRSQELFIALLGENVPTLMLLAVYVLCRVCRGRKNRRQMAEVRINNL